MELGKSLGFGIPYQARRTMTGPALPSSYSGCLRSSMIDFFTASKSPGSEPWCVGVLIVPGGSD